MVEAVKSNGIGTLNEKPLHAALKSWCSRPGDQFEVRVGGFVIDIVRPVDGRGARARSRSRRRTWAKLKRKLDTLVQTHRVRLVYPVAQEKCIVRLGEDGELVGRRRSPKRGGPELLFAELVSFPRLLLHPNFTLEVLLIVEEEVRVRDESVNWRRRGWATSERRLLEVTGAPSLREARRTCSRLLPPDLADPFTPVELARALDRPAWLARRMTYCLKEMGALAPAGKKGRSQLFVRNHSAGRTRRGARRRPNDQPETARQDRSHVDRLPGVLRGPDPGADGATRRGGGLVGQGHPRARHDMGGGVARRTCP